MSEPFLAEIRMVGFTFAPRGWSLCDGQILPISQNQSLYSLLGTTYGGDGETSFALPDLRGRTPIHVGDGHLLGQKGGEEGHQLTVAEMPSHRHVVQGTSSPATTDEPDGTVLPAKTALKAYRSAGTQVDMDSNAVTNAGGNQPHDNMQPYAVVNFAIALQGLFPSEN